MSDSALNAMAPWFFFHLTGSCAADVTYERRTEYACDSVLGDDAAKFVSGNAKQREIEETKSPWQTALVFRQAG